MIEVLLVAEQLLADGDLDRAEHLFGQVAEADARNAIAVVGLARVAQGRGDLAGALSIARRALVIDPEDAAAQGLVAALTAGVPGALEVSPPAPGLVPPASDLPPPARRSWLERLWALLGLSR